MRARAAALAPADLALAPAELVRVGCLEEARRHLHEPFGVDLAALRQGGQGGDWMQS